jgi:starch synthase
VRVLFATAEFAPVAVVGGLASASSGLVGELRRQGVEVRVVMPDYGGVPLADEASAELDVPGWAGPARVRTGVHADVGPLELVDLPGLARPHPYLQPDGGGWPDNDRRFLAFSQAVAALCRERPPAVLHLNDWHTAAALAALDPGIPSVLSLHNLAYQGECAASWLEVLGPRAAAYARRGSCNPLAGGIALADAIVAVSPRYAAEITTPEHGFGLDDLLVASGARLLGIRNGIDTAVWDSAHDAQLAATYDASDPSAKALTAEAVREELGLAGARGPLVVMVTRLTEQKGADLVPPLAPFLARLPAQLAVLGAGDAGLAEALAKTARQQPGRFAFVNGHDEALAHRLFAAGDLLLMPSRFEPCGLTQMQAMRYGTLPVATDVGGLHDTVVDADEHRDTGTGFLAARAEALPVLDALHRAVRAARNRPRLRAIQRRGMLADWSWREPAARYAELYERVAS